MSQSNMMPGDNSGADGPTCGRERASYQELLAIREKLRKWIHGYKSELDTREVALSDLANDALSYLSDSLLEWEP
jgi:hypothetical protein